MHLINITTPRNTYPEAAPGPALDGAGPTPTPITRADRNPPPCSQAPHRKTTPPQPQAPHLKMPACSQAPHRETTPPQAPQP